MVVAFKEENTVAFKHLFLKGYMDRMDDTYAVYTQTDVYDQIFFAINQVGIVAARCTIYMIFVWLPFFQIELLCQLLKTKASTHLGFLSLLEHCNVVTSLKLISVLALTQKALLESKSEFFASNKLVFIVMIIKRKT